MHCVKQVTFGPPERVFKHEYDIRTRKWSHREIMVSLASVPFQEGTNRSAFMLKDLSLPKGEQDCVAKLAKNPHEERSTYFSEVEMQSQCRAWAAEYNRRNPPRRIEFLQPCVLEFAQRMASNGKPLLMGVETQLKGVYKKFSNNYGFVSDDNRNTPHAFSHFTFHASNGQFLVCDIQGIELESSDLYTDPQIHTNLGRNIYMYGKGDMGIDGIHKFFASHRCNHICRALGLPNAHNAMTAARIQIAEDIGGAAALSKSSAGSRNTSVSSAGLSTTSSGGGGIVQIRRSSLMLSTDKLGRLSCPGTPTTPAVAYSGSGVSTPYTARLSGRLSLSGGIGSLGGQVLPTMAGTPAYIIRV